MYAGGCILRENLILKKYSEKQKYIVKCEKPYKKNWMKDHFFY